jgi:glucose/mannose-6-phosphate isomerase
MNAQHEALRKFNYQIQYSVDNYKPHGKSVSQFSNIVIGGLGGSGIGGRIVKSLYSGKLPVPVECIGDYTLPAYVNEKSLVILASYSGNTEETLAMYHEVKQRGATVFTLSTGGKLNEMAKADNLYFVQVEAGFQPRMALGFSLTMLVQIFAELVGEQIKPELDELAALFADSTPFEKTATGIFESVKQKANAKFIILTDGPAEPIGIRFAQQIQENAKHECFQHVLPEMNHNIIESYYGTLNSVFFLINTHQNERVNFRFDFIGGLLAVENHKIIELPIEEFTLRSVYETIYILDWVSLYLADYRGVDSLNVPNISSLKEFLDHAN